MEVAQHPDISNDLRTSEFAGAAFHVRIRVSLELANKKGAITDEIEQRELREEG